MTIATVSANEAQALIAQGARLIDIRAADEYAREHIPAATLLPLEQLTHGAALNAQPGDTITAEASLGDVESVKAVSEVLSPVSGTVTATNEALSTAPESINADPYGAWLLEVNNVTAFAELMDATAYEAFCANA